MRKHWFSRKAAANRHPASFPAFPSHRGVFRLLFGDFHLRPYISCGSQAAHGSAFHAEAALITVVPNLVLVFRDHVWLRRFGDVRKEHSRSSFFSHHESCPDLLTFQFSWSLIASLLQAIVLCLVCLVSFQFSWSLIASLLQGCAFCFGSSRLFGFAYRRKFFTPLI